ncbi:MAG: deoxyguanosinetriphosphate triphosphohydrolase [Armatimonadetes bacterium]|nr:deoxyguanosinetriphosphate triphosphohydrolase [Armatimonadota bacterium]
MLNTSFIRLQQEELERQILSPFATLSAESKGRTKPEEKCPIRTDFQRDRDRIIHSKAFRRLKHKTQVFIDPEEDHYRTRLTHTLEVSQIARTISRGLRLNEDLTEAIALGHDLGHTPFGHAGEEALDEVYREFVPNARFRHNEQSLRVIDIIEKDGCGLNLTAEVREGIVQHSKGSEDVDLNRQGNGTLEGQVVRIADRIAYINHDIDDAIRAGILREIDLPKDCTKVLGRQPSERIAIMVIDLVENSTGKPELSMSDEVLAAANKLKDFLFERVYYVDTPVLRELKKAQKILKELFYFYMEHPELLPTWYNAKLQDTPGRARAVCDFIAGMTDRYAEQKYEEYFMPHSNIFSTK